MCDGAVTRSTRDLPRPKGLKCPGRPSEELNVLRVSNKIPSRGRPSGGRHAAARPAPARATAHPARLAQGGVVAALAAEHVRDRRRLGQRRRRWERVHGASRPRAPPPRSTKARAGAVDVATDAIEVAQTVQTEAAQAPGRRGAAGRAAGGHRASLDELVAAADRGRRRPSTGAPRPPAPPTARRRPTPRRPPTPPHRRRRPPPDAPRPTRRPTRRRSSRPTPAPVAVPTIPKSDRQGGRDDDQAARGRRHGRHPHHHRARRAPTPRRPPTPPPRRPPPTPPPRRPLPTPPRPPAQAEADKAAQRAAWKQSLLGYANGKIPDSALCGVSFDASVRLRCDAAEQLEVLNAAYKAAVRRQPRRSTTRTGRTPARCMCKRTKGYLCATPGTSNHGSGIAVDLGGGIDSFGTAQHHWMDAQRAGPRAGCTRPGPSAAAASPRRGTGSTPADLRRAFPPRGRAGHSAAALRSGA